MTYMLFTDAKGYQGRLKKIRTIEKKAGYEIVSMEENPIIHQLIIQVEKKGGE
jgi:hypothetical protein